HLDMQPQLIPGPYRTGPAELVEARADDAAGGLELAVHEKPHRHRGGMPAARRQALEDRALRGALVEVEGLRIELAREGLDARLVHAQSAGAERLPDG